MSLIPQLNLELCLIEVVSDKSLRHLEGSLHFPTGFFACLLLCLEVFVARLKVINCSLFTATRLSILLFIFVQVRFFACNPELALTVIAVGCATAAVGRLLTALTHGSRDACLRFTQIFKWTDVQTFRVLMLETASVLSTTSTH